MAKINITDKPHTGDTIARNINHYMSHYKISRSKLANRLNVSKATVGYWCTGKKIPRMAKIDEMCKNHTKSQNTRPAKIPHAVGSISHQ